LANGFTELWDPNLPEHALRQLAEIDGNLLFYLVFGLLAAIVSWINKRKEAAKLEQSSHAAPTQRSQRPAQAGKPTGWLARLEQLAEAQLPKTDQELERQYAGNYELESVETPMIIPADDLPPVIGTTARQTHRTRETPKHSAAVHASRKARQPAPSPVYNSPIYTGNIAHRIGSDINIARQAVVASIILGQPRSLERPEQITRY
jgi:hypothetical protein